MDIATIQTYIENHAVELAGRALAAAFILVCAFIVARIARSAVAAGLAARAGDRRAATLAPAVQSLARITILGSGFVMALHQLGLNIATVLAGAGVLGLAIGFGAQAFVRDVISGFFLIVDGVVETGDHITFNDVSGIVEEIGLRMTQIRSIDGRLWYVPNGELKVVGNFNRDWARAVVDLPLALEQNVGAAIAVVQAVADAWAAENEQLVLDPPEAQGVLGVTSNGVDIRLIVKVQPMEHWPVERELARRIKDAFDAEGIETPFPRQVVYHRDDGGSSTGAGRAESVPSV